MRIEMRLARLVSFLLFLWPAAAIWAADPFAGTWKLNVERSDFSDGPKAKSGTATYTLRLGGYQYESKTVFGKGSIATLAGPVTFDGTAYPGKLEGNAIVFTSKKIDRNSYETLIGDPGTRKVTEMFKHAVSSDNKILTISWIKGVPDQPVVHWVLVYDRE
jgi:hypothetical protein